MVKPQGVGGLPLTAQLHIVDEEGNEVAVGESGTVYLREVGNSSISTTRRKQRILDTQRLVYLGDIGYVDKEGYLYLTDRKSFMIISGGWIFIHRKQKTF